MHPLNDYLIFIAIVENQGISAAAKALHCSKSMVSKTLSQLEQRLKTEFFNRTTRSMLLTQQGEIFYQQAKRIVSEIDELEGGFTDHCATEKGVIKMTTPAGMFGAHFVFPHIKSFMSKYPDIDFDINMTIERINLHQSDYDLAIRAGKLDDSSLHARKLCPIKYKVYTSEAYIEKHGVPETPQDLRHHRCLNIAHDYPWRFKQNGRTISIRPKTNFIVNSAHVLAEAAQMGHGITRLVNLSLMGKKRNLVPILEEYEEPESTLWVITRRRDLIPKRVKLLIDHLIEEMPNTLIEK